jgi:predicted ester cyclase
MTKLASAVEQMFKAIENGDTEDAALYISDDYLNRESVDDGRSDKRGPEEFRETVTWLRSVFSDLHFENCDVISCQERAVVVTYMIGRHTAEFLGLPATNRTFRQRQVHIFTIDKAGKVSEHLAQRDDLGLRRQLAG